MAERLDIAAEHAGLVAQLRAAGTLYRGGQQNDSYTGSGHPFFNVSAPELRRIGRAWLAARRKADDAALVGVVSRLFIGAAYEEKVLAAILLGANARMRRLGTPALTDGWLDELQGWAEIDSLCASVFGPDEMEADWPGWRDLIRRLAKDANINRRRAALVLLCRPARLSPDPRYRDLAFEVIEQLKAERPILITEGGVVAASLDGGAARTRGRGLSRCQRRLAAGGRGARDADQAAHGHEVRTVGYEIAGVRRRGGAARGDVAVDQLGLGDPQVLAPADGLARRQASRIEGPGQRQQPQIFGEVVQRRRASGRGRRPRSDLKPNQPPKRCISSRLRPLAKARRPRIATAPARRGSVSIAAARSTNERISARPNRPPHPNPWQADAFGRRSFQKWMSMIFSPGWTTEPSESRSSHSARLTTTRSMHVGLSLNSMKPC